MESVPSETASYAEHRRLFKDIWDTIDLNKDADTRISMKPKVIKTVRLDEVERIEVANRKKHRIKNLRTVCNKILDVYDHEEVNDLACGQMTIGQTEYRNKNFRTKYKLLHVRRSRRKFNSDETAHSSSNLTSLMETTSTRQDEFESKSNTSFVTTNNGNRVIKTNPIKCPQTDQNKDKRANSKQGKKQRRNVNFGIIKCPVHIQRELVTMHKINIQ